MRDEKDPGTIEVQQPKRRGRPPANGVAAKSAADHSRAYRQRRRAIASRWDSPKDAVTDMVLLDRLRMAISSGDIKAAGIYAHELQQRYPYKI